MLTFQAGWAHHLALIIGVLEGEESGYLVPQVTGMEEQFLR